MVRQAHHETSYNALATRLSRRELPLEMAEEGLGIAALARCQRDDLLRGMAMAQLMHMSAQPGKQAGKITAPDFILQGIGTLIGLGELGGIEAAQRVSGKIAEHAERPMHVLKNAL